MFSCASNGGRCVGCTGTRRNFTDSCTVVGTEPVQRKSRGQQMLPSARMTTGFYNDKVHIRKCMGCVGHPYIVVLPLTFPSRTYQQLRQSFPEWLPQLLTLHLIWDCLLLKVGLAHSLPCQTNDIGTEIELQQHSRQLQQRAP